MNNAFKYYEFSEIADIYNGNSISKKEKEENYLGLKDGTPYIATKDVGFDHLINYENGVSIPKSKWNEFRVAPEKSVFVCSEGGSAGRKIAYNERDVHFGNKLYAIVPKDTVVAKYLYYYVLSKEFKDSFFGQMTGLIGGVSLKKFKTIKVPVPHISKQKQLISILDEAFNGIDTAIANTEKNLANARELFESYLNSVFTNCGDNWEEVTLEEHIKFIDYRGRTPKKTEAGLRLITAKNVRMGYLRRDPEEYVSPDTYDSWMTRGIPKNGDVLFTTEAPLGLVCQLDTSEKVVLAQRIITMQPDRDIVDPSYLAFVLRSTLLQNRIHEKGTGATAKGIKASLLKKIIIPLPPLAEQNLIVEKLNSILVETNQLESVYQKKANSLNDLKKSLLQKAFSGELTVENNKLIGKSVT